MKQSLWKTDICEYAEVIERIFGLVEGPSVLKELYRQIRKAIIKDSTTAAAATVSLPQLVDKKQGVKRKAGGGETVSSSSSSSSLPLPQLSIPLNVQKMSVSELRFALTKKGAGVEDLDVGDRVDLEKNLAVLIEDDNALETASEETADGAEEVEEEWNVESDESDESDDPPAGFEGVEDGDY
jgi:hypothetical protein